MNIPSKQKITYKSLFVSDNTVHYYRTMCKTKQENAICNPHEAKLYTKGVTKLKQVELLFVTLFRENKP